MAEVTGATEAMKAACALVVAQFAGLHLYDLGNRGNRGTGRDESRERERESRQAMRKRAVKETR
jgi:hypothetical protein